MNRGFKTAVVIATYLGLAVASGAQQSRHVAPVAQTGPEMHGTIKAHRYIMVDADLRTDDQACSFDEVTKEVTCLKEGNVNVDILLAQEDAARFYPGLDTNCNGVPGSHPYEACKFDVLGAALTSLPSDAFKMYCNVEYTRGLPRTPGEFPIDGVPCDEWSAKNKSITEEMCAPEDLLEGGKYYPPPCYKRKGAQYDFDKDSTTRVTHCEDRATGQHVNCILGPTGSFNALIPITYRVVTIHSPRGTMEYFVRLEDSQGHVGFYGIDEQPGKSYSLSYPRDSDERTSLPLRPRPQPMRSASPLHGAHRFAPPKLTVGCAARNAPDPVLLTVTMTHTVPLGKFVLVVQQSEGGSPRCRGEPFMHPASSRSRFFLRRYRLRFQQVSHKFHGLTGRDYPAAAFAASLVATKFRMSRRVRSTNASLSARQLSSRTPTA